MKTYKVTVDERGTIRWYNEEGNLHCEHGPSVINSEGSVEYWIDGKLHREDGPAVIYSDGFVEYWIDGKLHREDGPAIIDPNGYQAYYINGVELTEEEFESRNTKEVTMEELHKLLGYPVKIKK